MDKIKGAFFENLPVFQFFRVLFSSKLWYVTALRDILVCHEAVTIFILFYELSYVHQDQ